MGSADIDNKGISIVVLVVVAATIMIDCGLASVTQRGPVTLAISDKNGLIYRIGLGINVFSCFCFNWVPVKASPTLSSRQTNHCVAK